MTAPQTAPAHAARHPWAQGLMLFAAVILMITGVLDVLRGIMGIVQDQVFLVTQGYVFRFDLTGWGWAHLVLGALAVIVSLGLFQSARWARFAGVAIAGFIIIAHFLSLPYSPVWSTLMIALSGLVMWALCVARPADSSGAAGASGAGGTYRGTPREQ
ncbi:hypothetical protein [Streptomyces sp. NPDC001843]|uniref:DUF7144 family membrane protein n=1 Tax=Streptomyces sp. NPDC001843 TaxID=3364617 RepID=UPI0036BFE434